MTLKHVLRVPYRDFCLRTSRVQPRMVHSRGTYDTDYARFRIVAETSCRLDDLRFNIHRLGLVPIWDTPHYAFFDGDHGAMKYRQYIETNYGSAVLEQTVSQFLSLSRFLDENPSHQALLGRAQRPWASWLLIVDGTHRAALAASRGVELVSVRVTDQ